MTRPSRRVADYAPSTLNFSAELVLAAAVEEAVALLRDSQALVWPRSVPRNAGKVTWTFFSPTAQQRAASRQKAEATLLAAATAADLILGRAR